MDSIWNADTPHSPPGLQGVPISLEDCMCLPGEPYIFHTFDSQVKPFSLFIFGLGHMHLDVLANFSRLTELALSLVGTIVLHV